MQEYSDYIQTMPDNFDNLEDDDNLGVETTCHFRDFGEVLIGL
jgi:hypothetical protein